MTPRPTNRDDIRDFLVSRRSRLTPEQVGLPAGTRRRVPGLRREEVAVLSGVSTEWYSKLEKATSAACPRTSCRRWRKPAAERRERGYLFDLARAARTSIRPALRKREASVAGPVQWLLDSVTLSAVFLRNGRLDVVASNALARALHAPHVHQRHGPERSCQLRAFPFP